jgi:putative ABC transport system permease protein
MGFLDLVTLILENLSRRKARVALTAVGVVIGTSAVVILVSLAIGLQRNANQQLYGIGDLTQIQVMPNYGMPAEGGPMVMQSGGKGMPGMPESTKLITNDSLTELAALPGVESVIPRDYIQGGVMLTVNRLEGGASFMGVGLSDLSVMGVSAQQGVTTLAKGTAVVGALVSQNFYDPRWRPGMPSPTPPELMGATAKLTLIKWTSDGTEVRKSIPIKITGVLTESRGEPDYTIYISLDEITAYNEWVLGRRINRAKDGYNSVIVKVADVGKVLEITDQITALGYQAYTPASFVQGINSFYIVLQVIFGGVGAIALLVAAIGIANTMAMAILERTREIGVMKAIGATNRDVLSIFLGEAAGIGFIGGLGGILVGWSAGQIINVLALAYFAGQSAQTGAPPPAVAVYTPAWLPIFTLIFATVIGLLSGLYPALRAATLIPVNALKYE